MKVLKYEIRLRKSYMSLLKIKKRRIRISGKFSYTIKNAIVFNRVRNMWLLRMPRTILRAASFRVGMRVRVSVNNGTLTVTKTTASSKRGGRSKRRKF